VDLTSLVLKDGALTRAAGRVVGYDGQVWFEPPMPVPPLANQPVRPSGWGVLTRGVDLLALTNRHERDGGVEGRAVFAGEWRQERLHVLEQQAQRLPDPSPNPRWDRPPCSPPTHGWPHSEPGPEYEPGVNLSPRPPHPIPGATAVTVFRPAPTQVVLVVATTEPAQAEALLRPLYGDAVCIVPSRWTAGEIEVVRAAINRHLTEWLIFGAGQTSAEDGQALPYANVTRLIPKMADWARSIPTGLLDVRVWLTPQTPPTPA
jgi:hypothetical protein